MSEKRKKKRKKKKLTTTKLYRCHRWPLAVAVTIVALSLVPLSCRRCWRTAIGLVSLFVRACSSCGRSCAPGPPVIDVRTAPPVIIACVHLSHAPFACRVTEQGTTARSFVAVAHMPPVHVVVAHCPFVVATVLWWVWAGARRKGVCGPHPLCHCRPAARMGCWGCGGLHTKGVSTKKGKKKKKADSPSRVDIAPAIAPSSLTVACVHAWRVWGPAATKTLSIKKIKNKKTHL